MLPQSNKIDREDMIKRAKAALFWMNQLVDMMEDDKEYSWYDIQDSASSASCEAAIITVYANKGD